MAETPVKLTGLLFALVSVKPGQDLAFNNWYDTDHVPENRALPGIFHAQRYYAPAALRALRGKIPEGTIRYDGGAYATIYYFESPVEEAQRVMGELAERMWQLDRMHKGGMPVWTCHFDLVEAHVRPGHFLSAGAFEVAPHKGILVAIREVIQPGFEEEISRWDHDVHAPDLLSCQGFAAVYRFRGHAPENRRIVMNISYLEEDPAAAVGDMRSKIAGWQARGDWLDTSGKSRALFTGPYQSIVPGKYDFIGS